MSTIGARLRFGDAVEDALLALDSISEIQNLHLPSKVDARLFAANCLIGDAEHALFDADENRGREVAQFHTAERALYRFLVKAVDALAHAADLAGDGAGPSELRDKIEAAGLAVADVCLTWQETDLRGYRAVCV